MLHARKRFGQHFLHDTMVLQKIVEAIQPNQDDHLVEVGPGRGALTHYLLPLVKQLDAIEIDRDLCQFLQHHFSEQNKLVLFNEDVLKFNFNKLNPSPHSLRIVGNIPYNISTPLLFKLFTYIDSIKDLHFMLQKEVVQRLTAEVGSHHYGRLSIMAQYFCQNRLLFIVGPESFRPIPKVDSAVIRMIPHRQRTIEANNINTLSSVVREAFTHRRKTLSNCLKKVVSKEEIIKLNIDPKQRPQELTVEEFVRISNSIREPQNGT